MSNTKQCDCCDLFRDDYEIETVASAQPGVRYIVCEDCIDQCPNGTICDLSGKTMKPDVEAALAAHGGGASNGHPGYQPQYSPGGGMPGRVATSPNPPQWAQQMMNQAGLHAGNMFGGPPPKQVHEIPEDAECPKHGGHWGDDQTCDNCTDEDGDPKKYRKPKPRKHLTRSQSAPVDSTLERLKLQMKAGLSDQGKPLSTVERADLQKIIDKYEVDTSEQDAINSIMGSSDDADEQAAIRSILGQA